MEVRVIRPGMLTTVQDLGRRGHLAEGIPIGGAADALALRLGNLLVGNPEGAPALEMTLLGPELEFPQAAWVCAAGAPFEGVSPWKPTRFEAGSRLVFGRALSGCRGYLCIAGGFAVPEAFGGRGTYLAGGFGGFAGRALREGDRIAVGAAGRVPASHWHVDERVLPEYPAEPRVRVIPGAQAREFGESLYAGPFTVSSRSDRMGMRLEGRPLERVGGFELLSSAVAPGTVQVPPDGNPIVLLADAQTLGGYPRAAHVISVDLPFLAQLRTGNRVRFAKSSLSEAHALLQDREQRLALLRQGLARKFTPA